MLPSKELLREVLESKLENGSIDRYYFTENDSRNLLRIILTDDINIYELAHKCKEWAFSKGYTVETYKKIKQERPITFIKIYCNNSNRYIKEYELAKTETFEADIRACEWIVENVK